MHLLPRLRSLAVGLVALAGLLGGCQSGGSKDCNAAKLPPRGSLELPPKEEEKPAEPEPCKHTWTAMNQATHSYTVYEDDVPVVKLCTPIACPKCGAVRHECQKEIARKRRR